MSKKRVVTCGHTQYGGCSVIHCLWLVSAFMHLDSEVASKSRTAHTAIRWQQVEIDAMVNKLYGITAEAEENEKIDEELDLVKTEDDED